MNAFQKQLILRDGKNMAELSNPHRNGVGQPLPPQKISIEQFEADKPKRQSDERREAEHG